MLILQQYTFTKEKNVSVPNILWFGLGLTFENQPHPAFVANVWYDFLIPSANLWDEKKACKKLN